MSNEKFELGEPLGIRVLLKLPLKKEIEGGIYKLEYDRALETASGKIAEVVALGSEAFKFDDNRYGKVEVGDTVIYNKHCGTTVRFKDKPELYRIIIDKDIQMKVHPDVEIVND